MSGDERRNDWADPRQCDLLLIVVVGRRGASPPTRLENGGHDEDHSQCDTPSKHHRWCENELDHSVDHERNDHDPQEADNALMPIHDSTVTPILAHHTSGLASG